MTSKAFSLRGQVWVHDSQGSLLFEATRAGVFSRVITIRDEEGQQLVSLLSQPWKIDPAWQISGQLGSFTIKRRKKSFQRHYWIESGEFDSCVIEGGSFDLAFRIRLGEDILAQAQESAFSLSTTHTVELVDESPEVRLLSALVAIIILKEKQAARRG